MAPIKKSAILQHLNGSALTRIREIGQLLDLPRGHTIYAAGERIRDVYFPIDCVLSVVTEMKDGQQIEIGTIGREGTSAIPLLMGAATTANDCFCQVPGASIRIPTSDFHRLMTNEKFRIVLDRYLQAYVNFLGQLTACNRLHSVYQRCARWLLLTHDRVDRDDISLTHEYLAIMLGSRRSGVSLALAALRREGYIRYRHGTITILNRRGLESTTCECYAIAREQFMALLRVPNVK
jgi:CRP-like cAMP-binding protein